MNISVSLMAAATLAVGLGMGTARAQEMGGAPPSAELSPATVPSAATIAPMAAPAPGAKVWLVDQSGQLGVLDMGTRTVTKKGNRGTVLTDIAFCPGGALYGISFNGLYIVNPNTGVRTRIGHGYSGPATNSLVCSASGTLLAGSNTQGRLYRLNRSTGTATALGGSAPLSAGDLAYHEGGLYLTTKDKRLAKLNKSTGAVLSATSDQITDLWGLVSLGTDKLYSFAGTNVYKFNENAAGPTGRPPLQFSFAGKGLGKIYGAAYNGNFQS